MIALYVSEVAIVVAAFIGMLKLRRIADQRWRRHLFAQRMAALAPTIVSAGHQLATMGVPLTRAIAVMEDIRRDMTALGAAVREYAALFDDQPKDGEK